MSRRRWIKKKAELAVHHLAGTRSVATVKRRPAQSVAPRIGTSSPARRVPGPVPDARTAGALNGGAGQVQMRCVVVDATLSYADCNLTGQEFFVECHSQLLLNIVNPTRSTSSVSIARMHVIASHPSPRKHGAHGTACVSTSLDSASGRNSAESLMPVNKAM